MNKSQQTPDAVLAKVGKIDTVEAQLTGISQQISSFDSNLFTLEVRTAALEGQYKKIVEKTDKMKLLMRRAIKNFAKLPHEVNVSKAESIMLKGMIGDLRNDLEQQKVLQNTESQYWRTCFNLKLCGIPIQPGKEVKTPNPTNPVTRAVVERVCAAADINLPVGSIDVCHRLDDDITSPIILRFSGNNPR